MKRISKGCATFTVLIGLLTLSHTKALADLSHTLAAVRLDFQAILDVTTQRTAELTGDACVIRLVSDDRKWLEVVSLYHPEPRQEASIIKRAKEII